MGIDWLDNEQLMVGIKNMRELILGRIKELETDLIDNEIDLFEGSIREQAKLISNQEISSFRIHTVPKLLLDHENISKSIQKEKSRLSALELFMQKLNTSEDEKKKVVDLIQGFYYRSQ